MVLIQNLQFSDKIGVLFALKELKKHKTLQETYGMIEKADMDTMVEVVTASYNKQNKTTLTVEQFIELADESNLGFIKITEIFTKVIENLLYSGLTEEEVDSQKKLVMSLTK